MLFILLRLSLILATILALPFLLAIAAVLVISNFLRRAIRLRGRPAPRDGGPLSGTASIIILNWNGKDLLAEGLPSVLEAVRADGRPHEVMVVDNGSSDGSVEYLAGSFPQVRTVSLPANLGFAAGNNAGVQAARNDVVVLLNNDMLVDRDFLRPLLDGFRAHTFAVSSQIFHQDPSVRREETGKTAAFFHRGMIEYEHSDPDCSPRPYYPAFWAGGGSSAFHRERFLALGGFQEVFSPAYVEDTDLSYRAWKAGWELRFAPGSVVHHKHRASTNRRFTAAQLRNLIQRNQLIFLWKNLDSWRLLLSHIIWLPWSWYRLARDHGPGIWLSFLQAAGRLPSMHMQEAGQRMRAMRSDEEIFSVFSRPGSYFSREREVSGTKTEIAGDGRRAVLWATAYLPHLGRHAGAARMYQMLKRIARKYRVTLVSFLEGDDEREFVPDLETCCERVIALPRVQPQRWQPFAYEPFDEFRTPAMERALQHCLENYDFDLLQLEYTQMACYGDRDLRIPTLLTKHEVDFAACGRRARLESNPLSKVRWFYNYLQVLDREIALMRRIDAAICMTDSDARELKKFCSGVPIHVINTGVDLDYFSPPAQPSTDPTLVFVGAFRHEPNVDAMLYFCREIFPLVRLQVRQARLLIVGNAPPPAIAGLSSLPGVEVTGFVPDMRPFMAAGAVYVVPLRLGVGIRGKILEAWAMGMAVVATTVAAAGLRCKHGENILLADRPDLFAAEVVSLLKNPSERLRLGREGRKVAEQYYSWDVAAHQLISLYEACMEKGDLREAAGAGCRTASLKSQEAGPGRRPGPTEKGLIRP